MAEGHSMTAAERAAKTLLDEHADVLKEAVAMVVAQLMEAEISAEIGAVRGEISPDRLTHRNGYRPRPWETRVGELELLIPRKRSGEAYFPSFLEPRRRCEQAIVAVVMEAYVNGVSTRKVDRLVEQLGIGGMTKDRVSALCRALDAQVEAFRTRPLEGGYHGSGESGQSKRPDGLRQGHRPPGRLGRWPGVLPWLVLVCVLTLSGCVLFERRDDFGKELTIENRTPHSLHVVYASRGREKFVEDLNPGETTQYVSQFNIEGVQCLEGDLIARSDSDEVARIHSPCRDTTWTISP
jgi:hypothetical protein